VPKRFKLDDRFFAYDILSGAWRLADVIKVYSGQWDESRAHIPAGEWVALEQRPRQVRVHFVGFDDADDCDILMCDVPYRLRHVTRKDAREIGVDYDAELDLRNDTACSNCLLSGADDGAHPPTCCDRCHRIYHPDCLRFLDRLTGSREEEEAREVVARNGDWHCPWCRRPELRQCMADEHAKNRARWLRESGERLLEWDHDREEEELEPPYGPARFIQFVKEYWAIPEKERRKKPRKKRKSYPYQPRKHKRKRQRRQPVEQQEQQPADEAEAAAAEAGEQQLEEEAKEDSDMGRTDTQTAANAPSAALLTQRAFEAAMEQVRQMGLNGNNQQPPSALRHPNSSRTRGRKRVRKREEVDILREEEEADGESALDEDESDRGSDGEMAGYSSLDGEPYHAAALLDGGGDYTPLSSVGGMSDAESHSPTSPSLSLPILSPHSYGRENDSDAEHEDTDIGGRRVAPLRSRTPTRDPAGNGAQSEVREVPRAKQEPPQTPPAPSSQLPPDFVLSPPPHALQLERNTARAQEAVNVPTSGPRPTASSTSVVKAEPNTEGAEEANIAPLPVPQPPVSSTSAPAVSSTSPPLAAPSAALPPVSNKRAAAQPVVRPFLPDDVIVLDGSDDEEAAPSLPPAVRPAPPASNPHHSPTAPALSASSSSPTSVPTVSASLSLQPSQPSQSSVAASTGKSPFLSSLVPRTRPQIRPSAAPSLLSSSHLSVMSSSSSSSATSSTTLSTRLPLPPPSSAASATSSASASATSVSQSPSSSASSISLVSSASAVSSRARSNRPASYSQRSIGQTGHMRSVRAGQVSHVSYAADGSVLLQLKAPAGLDLTRPQQLLIDIPPLAVQPTLTAVSEIKDEENTASLQQLATIPLVPTMERMSPSVPAVQSAPRIDLAQTAAHVPSPPSAPSTATVQLVDEKVDEETDEKSGVQSASVDTHSGDVPSPLQPSSSLPAAQPSTIADDTLCCFCDGVVTVPRYTRASSAQLAALGCTDEPNPQRKLMCSQCYRCFNAGRLPLSLMPGVNVDKCAICNATLSAERLTHRCRYPTARLASLGYNRPPPHPNNAHVCEPCRNLICVQKTLPQCIRDAQPTTDVSSSAALEEEEEKVDSQAASPSPSTSPCNQSHAASSPPALTSSSSDSNPTSFSQPQQPDVDMLVETEMEEARQSVEPAVLASRRQRVQGGEQSEFFKQLALVGMRDKRPRRPPNRFAQSHAEETTAAADSGEENEGAGSKKRKATYEYARMASRTWTEQEENEVAVASSSSMTSSSVAVSGSHRRPTRQRASNSRARLSATAIEDAIEGIAAFAKERRRGTNGAFLNVGHSTANEEEKVEEVQTDSKDHSSGEMDESGAERQAAGEENAEQDRGSVDVHASDSDRRRARRRIASRLSAQWPQWDARQVRRLMKFDKAGQSVAEMAVRLGRGTAAIKLALAALRRRLTEAEREDSADSSSSPSSGEDSDDGSDEHDRSGHRWTAQQDARLVEASDAGQSAAEIGKELGRSTLAVYGRLCGLRRRSFGESAIASSQHSPPAQQQSHDKDEEDEGDSEEDKAEAAQSDERTWTSQQDAQLLALMRAGKGCREIGRLMGNRSRQAVKSRLYRLRHGLTDKESRGEKPRQDDAPSDRRVGGRPRAWTEEKDQQLLALDAEGRSQQSIADAMGVSIQAVHNQLKRLRHVSRTNGETEQVSDDQANDTEMRDTAARPVARVRVAWPGKDEVKLRRLVAQGVSVNRIAAQMGRKATAVQARITRLKLRAVHRAARSGHAEEEQDNNEQQQPASDSDDDEPKKKEKLTLNDETWKRLREESSQPWLLYAQDYRTVKARLSPEEKEETAEGSDNDAMALFQAAVPVCEAAWIVSDKLRQRAMENSVQKTAEYGHSNTHYKNSAQCGHRQHVQLTDPSAVSHGRAASAVVPTAVLFARLCSLVACSGWTRSRRWCRWWTITRRGSERWTC